MNEATTAEDIPHLKQENLWLHRLSPKFLTILVLAISLGLTFLTWNWLDSEVRKDARASFDFSVRETVASTEQRMKVYEQVLRGARGLFAASGHVSRGEFRDYVSLLQLEKYYPGVLDIGISMIVPKARKAEHIAAIRAQGLPKYTIRTDAEREFYAPVTQLEPVTRDNQSILGFDMYSEPARRAALDYSRDTGRPGITSKVALMRDSGKSYDAGFIMSFPIYKNGMPTETLADRREAILGWVSAPFRMKNLMAGIGGVHEDDFHVGIYDGDRPTPQALMFDTGRYYPGGHSEKPGFIESRSINVAGRTWTMVIHSTPAFEARVANKEPLILAITGGVLSLVMAWLTWLLATGRRRALALATGMTRDLRESEARYSTLFHDNSLAILLIDPADGSIVNANEQASVYYGWDRPTLATMNLRDINTLPSDQLRLELQRAMEHKSHFNFQHRLANGNIRDVEIFVGAVTIGGRKLLLSSVHDITVRKQAEMALRESEIFIKTVLDSLVEQIAVLDSDGVIVAVNRAWLQFAKENGASESAEDWVGLNNLDICKTAISHDHGEEAARAHAGILAVLSGEQSTFSQEYPCHSPMEQRWFVMHVTFLQGAWPGVVVAHENITSQKLSEIEINASRNRLTELSTQLINTQEQERKNLARELHDEMGQKFATLNISLHNMRRFLSGAEAEESLHQAHEQVAGLVQFVRAVSGSLRPRMLDYLGLESAVGQLLHEYFSQSDITHVFEYAGLPERLPESIEIAVYRLIQESMTNVLRHANATNVIIEINGGENGDELEIVIRDNGKGFDPVVIEMSGRKSRSFGLIGMRERVNLLGGEFHVESEKGRGTRINVLLPLKQSANEEIQNTVGG